MPVFESVHKSSEAKQNYLIRSEDRRKSRKKAHKTDPSDSNTDGEDSSSAYESLFNVSFRPISKTDPCLVAGLSRDHDVPAAPFPHSAIKNFTSGKSRSIEDELAELNPPIFLHGEADPEADLAFRGQHIANLVAVLHNCILRGDWHRASRAWGLLLRTEVTGSGPDIRRHGYWTIGAEILLRRYGLMATPSSHSDEGSNLATWQNHNKANVSSGHGRDGDIVVQERAFELVREYYEGVILQYPATRYSQHNGDALTFYPALFSVWLYQIQAQFRQVPDPNKPPVHVRNSSTSPQAWLDVQFEEGEPEASDDNAKLELESARQIAKRLDTVLTGPPFDNNLPMLRLRGMIGIWISDLQKSLFAKTQNNFVDGAMMQQAEHEKAKGLSLLNRVQKAGHAIDISVADIGEEIDQSIN